MRRAALKGCPLAETPTDQGRVPTVTRQGPGRPRAVEYDRQILEAAVKIFAERGWSGFTLESVASAARVGKPALYLRWDSRQSLLRAALTELIEQPDEDFGSLRADIEAYIRRVYAFMLTENGRAWVRLLVEAPVNPDLEMYTPDTLLGPALTTFQGIAARATARGEITEPPSLRFLMEMVAGPIVMRVLHSPPGQAAVLAAHEDAYVSRLTDWVLAGMGAKRPKRSRR